MPPRSKHYSTDAQPGESTLEIKNVTVMGRRTSVRLEPQIWDALLDICDREQKSVHDLCTEIARRKPPAASLTAAIRVLVLHYFKIAATDEGHRLAGHGSGSDPIGAAFAPISDGS